MARIGKRVVDDLYVHLSALEHLENTEYRQQIEDAAQRLPASCEFAVNVAKLNLRTGRLSLLAYADFDENPFPDLAASWAFAADSTGPCFCRTLDTRPPDRLSSSCQSSKR